MYRYRPFVSKTYDFETTSTLYFNLFTALLELFHLTSLERYYGSMYDYHTVRFCCDPDTRLRIEYIFRRAMGLKKLLLLDLDSYQDRAKRYREENYAIF